VQTRLKHSPKHWLGGGVTSGVRFGLAHSSDGLYFLDDFSKVICDLAYIIFDSSSVFNCGSFGVFYDSGRRLIIAGQE
jgi:hypothetical protein